MTTRGPVVLIADDRDRLGVGRPDSEPIAHPVRTVMAMSAQHPIQVPVLALAKQKNIQFAEGNRQARQYGRSGCGHGDSFGPRERQCRHGSATASNRRQPASFAPGDGRGARLVSRIRNAVILVGVTVDRNHNRCSQQNSTVLLGTRY
ncbi:hypothetical protein NY78_0580 [Desulfovibrio sp. TomC]|nr:hypothetical protein NY78_0580 [Desulfovibrio sp. TomC]